MPAHCAAARVARLETVIRPPARKGYQPSALDIRLARFGLSLEPDLALVSSEDTDPETFRSIRERLAFASGDLREGARLRDLAPQEPPLPRLPGETGEDALRRTLNALDEQPAAQRLPNKDAIAIGKARARVAAATTVSEARVNVQDMDD